MSRSVKKSIIKDRPRNRKKSTLYWRTIRRIWKQVSNSFSYLYENELGWDEEYFGEFCKGEIELDDRFRNQKEIVNDYDYCDYTFIIDKTNEDYIKFKRK